MNTRLFSPLIAILLVGFMVVGCKQKTGTDGENPIKFDSISIKKTYHILDNAEYPACNLQVKFIFPVKYADKEVLAAVSKQFVSSFFGDIFENYAPKEAVDEYAKLYVEDYKSLEPDYKKELDANDGPIASLFSYEETSSNEITYNKHDILCYSTFVESYTGGAHGSGSTMNYVINLKDGKVLTEEDIFIPDFQDELAQMLVDRIAEQNDVKNPKELESVGFFSIDEIFPNGNFQIDDEGITYYFNEYEIAAYVVGLTTVKLPYKQIKHLLRKDSPIAKLI